MGIRSRIYSNYSDYYVFDTGDIVQISRNCKINQNLSSDGYSCVTLRHNDGKRKTFKVHRLVALIYVENTDNKPEVNHKDGVKTNNNYSNLEWMTHSENIQHAWDNGLLTNTSERRERLSSAHRNKKVGKDNHKSKFIRCIDTGEIFESANLAAKKYQISQSSITRCANNKYGHKTAATFKWEFYNDKLSTES